MHPKLVWVDTSYSAVGRFVPCWELVERTVYAYDDTASGFRDHYTGMIVFPDGRLLVGNHPPSIDCASVEEAKELGVTTYLLTKKGE